MNEMKDKRCSKCGSRLLLLWVGGTVPWLACPKCDAKELNEKLKTDGILM